MRKRSCQAFSLIELIVVVGIIAGLTGFIIPRFSIFTRQQTLQSETLRLQSALKNIQSNAISGVVCSSNSNPAKEWNLIFAKDATSKIFYKTEPDCSGSASTPTATFKLPDEIIIDNISSCLDNPIEGRKISFANISGKVNFNSPLGCAEPQSLIITLKSVKTAVTSQVIIDKGGSIKVQ